jgi:Ca2+-binding EF-hand superfamily protein
MWSVGVMLYTLLCGAPPYTAQNAELVRAQIYRPDTETRVFGNDMFLAISEEGRALIRTLLSTEPHLRGTTESLLSDPWMTMKMAVLESSGRDSSSSAQSTNNKESSELRALNDSRHHLLSQYKRGHQLKHMSMTLCTSLLTPDEILAIRERFHELDINGDGHLSAEEISSAISTCFSPGEYTRREQILGVGGVDGINTAPSDDAAASTTSSSEAETLRTERMTGELKQLIQSADFDGNGMLEIEEFFACIMTRNERTKNEMLRRTFNDLDRDHDEIIGLDEIGRTLREHAMPGSEVKLLLEELEANCFDQNGGSKGLSYNQFETVLRFRGRQSGLLDANNTAQVKSGSSELSSASTNL